MALMKLSLATLGELDKGLAGALIDAEIAAAIADLEDRGEQDHQPRKVVMTLELKIKEGMTIATVHCQAKVPPRVSGGTSGEIKIAGRKPELLFQSLNPDRADQGTFPELDNDKE